MSVHILPWVLELDLEVATLEVTPFANFASRFFFSSSSFCSFSCLLIFFSYKTYLIYHLYFRMNILILVISVVRCHQRLFPPFLFRYPSQVWVQFHLSNLTIWQSRRWRKVHYPCHIKLSQMKKKNPMNSMESACLQWMFWAFDWRNSPRRPSLFQIDTSQITQMSDKNLLSYLNWKSRISGQTPIDRYCSNLLWVSNPHFALKSVDGVLLRKHLFLVYFLNSNG